MNVVNPLGMTFVEWADAIALVNVTQVPTMKAMSEDDWQRWAVSFLNSTGRLTQLLPNPYTFESWRLWAQRTNELLTTEPAP
jgi:hypothetical protein